MVGFIGLGIMGRPMAKNLLKAGFPLVVSSRSRGSVEDLVKEGALSSDSPDQACKGWANTGYLTGLTCPSKLRIFNAEISYFHIIL